MSFSSNMLNESKLPVIWSSSSTYSDIGVFYNKFIYASLIINLIYLFRNQTGADGPKHTPHVFPFFKRINPFSPQSGPQEFLMVHESALDPIMKTA